MADGLSGFVRVTAKNRSLVLLFDTGEFQGALYDGKPVRAGEEAAAAESFSGGGAFLSVVEVPAEQAPIMAGVFFGEKILGDLSASLINLKELVKKYRGSIRTGALILNNEELGAGVVGIEVGKWLIKTPRDEFERIYMDEKTELSLYSFDKIPERGTGAVLQRFWENFEKPDTRIRDVILRMIGDRYPQNTDALVSLVEREYNRPEDLESLLEKIEEYLNLFVDGRNAGEFTAEMRENVKHALS
jgi:hypothetical protein